MKTNYKDTAKRYELAESETDLTKPTETYKEKEREVYNPPVYKDKFN